MGVKTKITNHSLKIYGNPKLEIKNPIKIKNYLKDHRIFMMSTSAALTIGGNWKLYDPESIKTNLLLFFMLLIFDIDKDILDDLCILAS